MRWICSWSVNVGIVSIARDQSGRRAAANSDHQSAIASPSNTGIALKFHENYPLDLQKTQKRERQRDGFPFDLLLLFGTFPKSTEVVSVSPVRLVSLMTASRDAEPAASTRQAIQRRGAGMLAHPFLRVFRGPSAPSRRAMRKCVPESHARRGGWKATRNLCGTEGSGPTMRSSFATSARQPESKLAGSCWIRSVKSAVPLFTWKNTTSCRDKIALHQDLIDLLGPIWARRISEVSIKDNVLTLLPQSWRGVDLGSGVGAFPLWNKQVVK